MLLEIYTLSVASLLVMINLSLCCGNMLNHPSDDLLLQKPVLYQAISVFIDVGNLHMLFFANGFWVKSFTFQTKHTK